jgi:hypothetical protein
MSPRSWAASVRRRVADVLVAISGRRPRPRPLTDRGGATGTPSHDPEEAPHSLDQETNWVVSGGGVTSDAEEPSRKARRSR